MLVVSGMEGPLGFCIGTGPRSRKLLDNSSQRGKFLVVLQLSTSNGE